MANNIQLGQQHIVVSQSDLTSGEFLQLVQIRRAGTFILPNFFTDIAFDVTDYETDATVIEHNNTNTARIDIKVAAFYLIAYTIPVDVFGSNFIGNTIESRIHVNGSTTLIGSNATGGTNFTALGLGTRLLIITLSCKERWSELSEDHKVFNLFNLLTCLSP